MAFDCKPISSYSQDDLNNEFVERHALYDYIFVGEPLKIGSIGKIESYFRSRSNAKLINKTISSTSYEYVKIKKIVFGDPKLLGKSVGIITLFSDDVSSRERFHIDRAIRPTTFLYKVWSVQNRRLPRIYPSDSGILSARLRGANVRFTMVPCGSIAVKGPVADFVQRVGEAIKE